MYQLGIDVSKAKLDVCLLCDGIKGKRKTKSFGNTAGVAQKLAAWLLDKQCPLSQVCAVMEATGSYHENVAFGLYEQGLHVVVANPSRVRELAKGMGILTKNDTVDAFVLACYGALKEPEPWTPPPEEIRLLRALLRRRDALLEDVIREENRLEKTEGAHTPEVISRSIKKMIEAIRSELKAVEKLIAEHIDNHPNLKKDLNYLTSIKGVGPQLGMHMLALLRGNQFNCAQQAAAYIGVVPIERASGTSVQGRSHLSKTGPAEMRAKLFMCAMTAVKYNKHINAQYKRLLEKGKSKMSALGAAMRKLVHLCYGVLAHQQFYDENYCAPA